MTSSTVIDPDKVEALIASLQGHKHEDGECFICSGLKLAPDPYNFMADHLALYFLLGMRYQQSLELEELYAAPGPEQP